MNELMLDVGQANELKLAFRRAEWTPTDIKRLCEGNLASKLLPVVRGLGDVTITKHVIDCDANPHVPDGWKVESHRKHGSLEWDLTKIQLYLSPEQQGEKRIEGNKLRKELENQPVLNANVLDYLLKHPELIPEEWKKQYTFFWGTIYRSSAGNLYVRCLCWDGESRIWLYGWLEIGFDSGNPAAVAGK